MAVIGVCLFAPLQGQEQPAILPLTTTDYGLLFTEVNIKGKTYTAMVDWGDFAPIQLSSALIEELKLETHDSDIEMTDVNGQVYVLQQGHLDTLRVGGQPRTDLTFYSANGEIAAVSQQVGTAFHVVLGWGFFAGQPVTLDLPNKQLILGKAESLSGGRSPFRVPIQTDYGYLIGQFVLENGDHLPMLIDTGSPLSQLHTRHEGLPAGAGAVNWQGTDFPVRILTAQCDEQTTPIHAEVMDLTALEPLGVKGILGLHDLKDKVLVIRPEQAELHLWKAP